MPQDSDVTKKLDKLLEKMESFDRKLDSVEGKMDLRLSKVEDQCASLQKKAHKTEKRQSYLINEVTKLKASVNLLEQEKLSNNIIMKGVKEIEGTEDTHILPIMVKSILETLDSSFESRQVLSARRIGVKKNNNPRLIVVEMVKADCKLKIMKNLKGKDLNCSQFNYNGVTWGSPDDKIFLNDQLTPISSNLFFQARQLRKNNKVKYAWSKLGKIYIKKDDNSRAYHIKCLEQLIQLEKRFLSKKDESVILFEESSASEQGSASEDESAMDSEVPNTDAASQSSSTKNKRARSKDAGKKSPRPKRVRQPTK